MLIIWAYCMFINNNCCYCAVNRVAAPWLLGISVVDEHANKMDIFDLNHVDP